MTGASRERQSLDARLAELQNLLKEGLITDEEHDEHAQRIRREAEGGSTPTESTHGNAVEMLDALIAKWSKWDENERYYLDELAPRMVRSDDPEFRWMSDDEEERVIATRLKALMSDDEWPVLPELIEARRGMGLHELESDRGRPERLANMEGARRIEELERRRDGEWAAAQERARREGEARIRREQAAESDRLRREAQAERDRAAREAEKTEDAPPPGETEESPDDAPEERPARGRRRRQRGRGPRTAASAPATRGRPDDAPAEAHSETPTGVESSTAGAGTEAPRDEPSPAQAEDSMGKLAESESAPTDAVSAEVEPAEPTTTQGPGGSEAPPERRDERTEPDVSDEPPPPEAMAEPDPGEDDGATAAPPEAAEASAEGPDRAEAPPGDLGEITSPAEDEDTAAPQPPGEEPSAAETEKERVADLPDHASPGRSTVAAQLDGYARRLTRARERSLADAVSAYADRVDAVEHGELPPSMGAAPTAIAPEMVGTALSRSRIEGAIEVVRNALIFMPVLWTWLKLQTAVMAYGSETREGVQFFNFWVHRGGSGWIGGTLGEAAQQVAVVLILLIAVNVTLGLWRRRTTARGARIANEFAATLAGAETAGAARRIADPQAALEGFVFASNELSTNLRSVGASLERSVTPFADSVGVAQQTLREMSDAVTRQERQLAEVVERLGRVAEIGDQLGALHRDFEEAQGAARLSAEALAAIRDSLGPSASDFAGAAVTLEQLAEQLTRMTEAMAGAMTQLDSGLDSSAGHLREAATSMNAVATRVLDDLDGRGGQR